MSLSQVLTKPAKDWGRAGGLQEVWGAWLVLGLVLLGDRTVLCLCGEAVVICHQESGAWWACGGTVALYS
jgi:hypothetical protein